MSRISFIFLGVFVLFSCGGDSEKGTDKRKRKAGKEKSEIEGVINISGDELISNLIVEFGKNFRNDYNKVQVNSTASDSETALHELDNGNADVIFISTPCSMLDQKKYHCAPVFSDYLVLMVNFNNVDLQALVRYGISQKQLSLLLQGKISDWQQISKGVESKEPVKLYIPSKKSGSIHYLSEFADTDVDMIQADDLLKEKDIPETVGNIPISIGICSHTLAYNHQTTYRRNGIYILGIDFDNSNFLENEELIFDDMNELQIAVKNGKAHPSLHRNFSIVYRKDSEKIELLELFNEHVQGTGKTVIEKYKFYHFTKTK
jgi:ABC-type phosphate transport system substrate-binding protein